MSATISHDTPQWWLDMSSQERSRYNHEHPNDKLFMGAPYSEKSPSYIDKLPSATELHQQRLQHKPPVRVKPAWVPHLERKLGKDKE